MFASVVGGASSASASEDGLASNDLFVESARGCLDLSSDRYWSLALSETSRLLLDQFESALQTNREKVQQLEQAGVDLETSKLVTPPELPEGAVLWNSMAVSPADAERLQQMTRWYDQDRGNAVVVAERVFGDQFSGILWSYEVGFVISVVGAPAPEAVGELSEELGGAPFLIHEGKISHRVAQQNLAAIEDLDLSDLGVVGSQVNPTCGVLNVLVRPGVDHQKVENSLNEILEPGSFQIETTELEPQNYAGKRERKSTLTGGLKIFMDYGQSNPVSNWCTSNVVWRKGSLANPEPWIVTAGHCATGANISGTTGVVTTSNLDIYQGSTKSSANKISKYKTPVPKFWRSP